MRYFALILILLAFGFSKLKFEQHLAEEHRAAYFHGAKLNLNMRQQIGQMGFLAALSGFRSLVADALWIEAHSSWERTEWGKMALLFDNVTALQPRCILFWEMSAWHMGYNASVSARNNPKQPREALRIKAQREYFKISEDFLLRGIENNPDRYNLYEHLAILYREKFQDHEKAFEWFDKAKDFKDAPVYEKRFAAFEISYCPGREREAYARLLALYNRGEQERVPTLITRLKFLEEKLNVPPGQRVYIQPGKKQ